MMDTTERPCTDKITEPAKQWRNWYRALRKTSPCPLRGGKRFKRGDIFPSTVSWPTKEIAEQKYLDEAAERSKVFGINNDNCEHLGAFPDGVTP